MNNFRFDITSVGHAQLTHAIDLATQNGAAKAIGYSIEDDGKTLVFFRYECAMMTALPFKLNSVGIVDFIERWLAEKDYGQEPDHDGDNGKGWRIYNEAWGHVKNRHEAFLAVEPAWAMYGK